MTSGPLTTTNCIPHTFALARASTVLPHPEGPRSSMPLAGVICALAAREQAVRQDWLSRHAHQHHLTPNSFI